MKKNIAEHLPLREREGFLRDNCDDTETMSYMKHFTEEEIGEMKSRLSTVSIEMNDIEEEKKDAAALFKARMDPFKVEKKELLSHIKQKAVLVKEECYKFVDYEEGRVYFYNAIGEVVDNRPILPSERQASFFSMKAVND